ncbi:MAG TPA: hypothetical protein VMU53_03555 [Candidatus Sulfotelmatobacter sp.]|nr:hypothetical protein [Candidatus Sulfotelmatobacter sp.]
MRTLRALGVLFLAGIFFAPRVMGTVYVRWTQAKLPPAQILGTNDLVIPWGDQASSAVDAAKKQGYRVYLEATMEQAATAAETGAKLGVAGILVSAAAQGTQAEESASQLRKKFPKLQMLVISPGGKQPEMRGWLVFNKNGMLQVSSPSAQPWLDQNLTSVRYDRAFLPSQTPIYSFSWDQSDPLVQEHGPKPADFSLAIVEAGAFHADLVLELPESKQQALANGDKLALEDWEPVKRTIAFYDREKYSEREAAAVGVLTDDYDAAYEPLNLMARHNIPFRVLHSADVKPQDLAAFNVIIEFSQPGKELTSALQSFAESGGVVVLVNTPAKYPWDATAPKKAGENSVSYTVGKGRIIELAEPVSDPETFAQDVRRLMAKDRIPVSLWNSLTTLVVEYPGGKPGEAIVELVNYDEEPTQVQVQVKGTFESVKFESPDAGCCETLKPSHVDGFTDFVVPNLLIGGRVHLQGEKPAGN